MNTSGNLSVLLSLGAVLVGLSAQAQFRPPPLTEAQRISRQAEPIRLDGSKALLDGKNSRAADRFKKAAALYEEALKHDPQHVEAGEGFGECASVLGENEKVVALLTPVIAAHPQAINIAYYLGVALLKTRQVEQAIPHLELVSAANSPEHLVVHFYLGRYYLAMGRADAAVAELEGYLRQRPERLGGNDHEIHALLGQAHLMGNRGARARASFQAAQQGRPESLPLQLGIATALDQEGKQQEAIKMLDGLAVRFPSSPEPRERSGWLLLGAGNLARAEQLAGEAVRLQAGPGAYQLAGEVQLAKKNPKGAEAHLRKALELAPQHQPIRFSLARALQQQGRHPDAIGLLEQAAQGGLSSVELWANLGSTYRRAGRFQEAVTAHRKVLELDPKGAYGHMLLGADYYATGEWDLAIDSYGLALKAQPDHAGARRWLATCLAHRARVLAREEQLDDAARLLRRAWDLERTAPMARSLAAVLVSQQAYEEAAEILGRGVELPQAGWREHLLRGYALLGAQKAPAALESFEAAARLTQDGAALGEIYAGWALTKLELGEFDTALDKLLESGRSGRAAQVAAKNLPLALVRRALDKLRTGDAEGSLRDLESLDRLQGAKDAEVLKLALYARGLLAVEQGRYDVAKATFRKALAGKNKWAYRNSAQLAEAYLQYRKGDIRKSRLVLNQLKRLAVPSQAEYLTQLQRGQDRKEGELAYNRGQMPAAEKALRSALQDDPLNAWVINNLAAVQYRKGRHAEALASWEKVASAVPEARLNLGIDAQVRQKDIDRAVLHYARYVASGGRRAPAVREWKDRLMAIYGVAEPAVEVAPAGDAAADPATTVQETP